ncbi:MAG: DNA recombination protein RmuC, partial [Nitrospinae bacterium]|nr:DNA recombination protein RmuC [Nitrospinota bacterium]
MERSKIPPLPLWYNPVVIILSKGIKFMADTSLILLIVVVILALANLIISVKKRGDSAMETRLKEVETAILKFDTILGKTEESIKNEFQRNRTEINEISKTNREEMAKSLASFEERFSRNAKELKEGIEKQLNYIREDNNKQIAEMRNTVDEKLQTTLEKRLGESFKQVSERLELVHKGLGDMQTLATGVGDLKKVLSNVKTRGIIGEYQLGNILEQIFSPSQYAKNVATKKGSRANIEYAIKYPGNSPGQHIWLPIDAKFPQEDYNRLIDAYDAGDVGEIEIQRKNLLKTIESFAKDISDKYI